MRRSKINSPRRPKRNQSGHVTPHKGQADGQGLFFGDHCYPTIKRIFDKTKERKRNQYLEWDVMLTAHHCSKSAMYWQDDPEKGKCSKATSRTTSKNLPGPAPILSSSESDFSDKEGKNPSSPEGPEALRRNHRFRTFPPHSRASEHQDTRADLLRGFRRGLCVSRGRGEEVGVSLAVGRRCHSGSRRRCATSIASWVRPLRRLA